MKERLGGRADQGRDAKNRFRHLMILLVVVGIAMIVAALLYLRSYGLTSPALSVTVALGVFVSILLGGGLMATGFYSADSGTDDSVAGAARHHAESIENPSPPNFAPPAVFIRGSDDE